MRLTHLMRAFAPALLAAALLHTPAIAAEQTFIIPAAAVDIPPGDGVQTAVLAGGCFWGVQAVFQHTQGVTRAVSGYSGGTKESAKYTAVSAGRTDHAEVVEVTFDPKKISYGKILQIYFSVAHDPTQLNRQGPDSGTQYRSAIFYKDDAQKKAAEAYIAQLNATKVYPKPIATKLEKLDAFYPAEDYHQDYAYLNPTQPYIFINDAPKVKNLQRVFADLYREKPALVRAATN